MLRAMRDDVLLSQIPVIMVTGSDDEASRVKALSFGANDFILKPFNPEIIRHCLKNNIALREIVGATHHTAQSMSQLSDVSRNMAGLSSDMDNQVSRFRLENAG